MSADPTTVLRCAERLHVLGDKTRLAILRRLMVSPLHVGELAQLLKLEQSLVSHHLRTLRESGFVRASRDGKAVLYEIEPGTRLDGAAGGIDLGCCRLSFAS